MSDAKAIADDIVQAFAVSNFNLTWSSVPIEVADDLRAKIAEAILNERESCAQVAAVFPKWETRSVTIQQAAQDIAAVIRARSTTYE